MNQKVHDLNQFPKAYCIYMYLSLRYTMKKELYVLHNIFILKMIIPSTCASSSLEKSSSMSIASGLAVFASSPSSSCVLSLLQKNSIVLKSQFSVSNNWYKWNQIIEIRIRDSRSPQSIIYCVNHIFWEISIGENIGYTLAPNLHIPSKEKWHNSWIMVFC